MSSSRTPWRTVLNALDKSMATNTVRLVQCLQYLVGDGVQCCFGIVFFPNRSSEIGRRDVDLSASLLSLGKGITQSIYSVIRDRVLKLLKQFKAFIQMFSTFLSYVFNQHFFYPTRQFLCQGVGWVSQAQCIFIIVQLCSTCWEVWSDF